MNSEATTQQPVLTHIGGPTVLINYAGMTFLTDPTFDAPGEYPVGNGYALNKLTGPALQPDELGKIDIVLLSHDQHADNLDHSGKALLKSVGLTLSTTAAAGRITEVQGLQPWEKTELEGGVTVTAVPALHGPVGSEEVTGDVTGFILQADGWATVYVSGDNASLDLAAEISHRFPDTEVALVFAGAARTPLFDGAPLTLTSEDVVELARLFPQSRVVPVHTEGWRHFTEGADVIQRLMEEAGLGDRLSLPLDQPSAA